MHGALREIELTTDGLFLREDVYVEPLISGWYAWPFLLPPVGYALFMTRHHIRLLNSFIANHKLHALANSDPTLAGGGEFVHCSAEQLDEVRELARTLTEERTLFVRLASAIDQLDALVRGHESGESFEPLYARVPDILKGYVELVMDLHHQPAFRLLESLLYRTPLYDTSLQSISFGSLAPDQKRPFVLSTPRFPDARHLHVQVPFASPRLDTLFRAREQPLEPAHIRELFCEASMRGGLQPTDLFSTSPPRSTYRRSADSVRVRYIGHAGILVEDGTASVLIDPVVATRVANNADAVFGYSDLPPRIDFLCITHAHGDHLNIETLLQLRYKVATVIVPKNNGGSVSDPSLKLLLRQLGFTVMELDYLEEAALGDCRVQSLPFMGEHGDLDIRSKSAWLICMRGRKIFAGADSANLEPRLYEHLHAITGDLDVLAIGMECVGAPYTWIYGAYSSEPVSKRIRESRRLNGSNCDMAVGMVEALHPKRVFVYALGTEPWYEYFMGLRYANDAEQLLQSGRLAAYCAQKGIPCERLEGRYELLL